MSNHYYSASVRIEPVDLCGRLGFMLGNVVKYLARAQWKGQQAADLEKAADYWERYKAATAEPVKLDPVADYLFLKFGEKEKLIAELYAALLTGNDSAFCTELEGQIKLWHSVADATAPGAGNGKE